MSRYQVVIRVKRDQGEREDAEGNYCGHETKVTIETVGCSSIEEIGVVVRNAEEDAADWGDGISGSRVLAVYDTERGNVALPTTSDRYP